MSRWTETGGFFFGVGEEATIVRTFSVREWHGVVLIHLSSFMLHTS